MVTTVGFCHSRFGLGAGALRPQSLREVAEPSVDAGSFYILAGGFRCGAGRQACHVGGLADRRRRSLPGCHFRYMFCRRPLPHWQPEAKPIFLTWHLKGSLSCNRYPPPSSQSAGKAFVWMDRFLDTTRAGPFWLRMEPIAALVVEAIFFGQDELGHYEVGPFVVMPNHAHLPLTPKTPMEKLARRLKGYTARVRIARYIENNPVAAGLAAKPEDYSWSSANPAIAIRRQDCRRGAQDCALHIHPGTPSEM